MLLSVVRLSIYALFLTYCSGQLAPGAQAGPGTIPNRTLQLVIAAAPAPPGAIAQVRVWLESPRPLSSGSFAMEIDPTVFGEPRAVEVFSAAGDQTGSVSYSANRLKVAFSSKSGGIGRLPGVPILAITIPVQPNATQATALRLLPDGIPWRDSEGYRYTPSTEPAAFRPGGLLTIEAVTPGSGLLPEGTVVRIAGRGFNARSAVSVSGVPVTSTELDSSGSLHFRIGTSVDLTGRQVKVTNPAGEPADFYAGTYAAMTSQNDGTRFQYVFPRGLLTRASANVFALLNPHSEPVTVRLHFSPIRVGSPAFSTTRTLAPNEIYYSWLSGVLGSPTGFDSPVGIRAAITEGGSATGITAHQLELSPPSYACSERISFAAEGVCWLMLAGSGPATAKLKLSTSGNPLQFESSVQSASGDWLKLEPERGTASEITVVANPSSLGIGDHEATVRLRFTELEARIPVTLRVAESIVEIRNPPPYFYFIGASTDAPPPPIQMEVIGTKPGTPFRLDIESIAPADWLLITPRDGVTPATLDVTFDPRVLGKDLYRPAKLILRGPGNIFTRPAAVEIRSPAPILALTQRRLVFVAPRNGPVPANQTIGFGYSGLGWEACWTGVAASVSSAPGESWLSAQRGPGTGQIVVAVDPSGLATGDYAGEVTIAVPGNSACSQSPVAVQLAVRDTPPPISVEPSAFTLTAASGGSTVVTGQVRLAEFAYPAQFSATVSADDGGNWLQLGRAPVAPGEVAVEANASELPPGTYRGAVRLHVPPDSLDVITIPVTFAVGPALPSPGFAGPPQIISIVNAASQAVSAIAPGELVTLHGSNLKPSLRSPAEPDRPPAVTFDGVPARVLHAGQYQLNVAVPGEIAGKRGVRVAIESDGLRSETGTAVAATAPGLFTESGTGVGQLRALHLPAEEQNSVSRPAARGADIRLFATGLGGAVSVRIGGVSARVKRLGSPTAVALGVFEIDVEIPASIGPGPAVPVVIESAFAFSQERATIAVR